MNHDARIGITIWHSPMLNWYSPHVAISLAQMDMPGLVTRDSETAIAIRHNSPPIFFVNSFL
jgi:hypothetical protein